jgi:hypothetical protein
MKGAALVTVIAALGMRHGVDPDHLSVIDGLSRFHPSRWNRVYFALAHGITVTLLAVGFGKLLAGIVAPYTVWILLALGFANLWRLWRPKQHKHPKPPRLFQASPLLLILCRAERHRRTEPSTMTPRLRKLLLTAHITFSVGWFGAVAAFLALAITGLTSRDAQMVRTAYAAMELTARFVIVPLAFASLLSGIVQSLGTPWGLFRHYWVLAKMSLIGYAARRAAETTSASIFTQQASNSQSMPPVAC